MSGKIKYKFYYTAQSVCDFLNENHQIKIIQITHAISGPSSYFYIFYKDENINEKGKL